MKSVKWLMLAAVATVATLQGRAEWTSAGEVQFASLKALAPQMNTLAAKANFPLLPMLAPQFVSKSGMAEKFGQPRQDGDWGLKLYVSDETMETVWAWPLEGGKEAWLEDNDEKKPEADGTYKYSRKIEGEHAKLISTVLGKDEIVEFATFSADGKWAFLSENAELAKRAAKEGAPFAKPLVKGIALVKLEGEKVFKVAPELFAALEARNRKIKKAAKENGLLKEGDDEDIIEEDDGCDTKFSLVPKNFPGPEVSGFFYTLLKEFRSVNLLVGISKTGLDVRVKAVPAKDSVLNGYTGALKSGELSFDAIPDYSSIAWSSAAVHPEGELGKAWKAMADGIVKSFRDHLNKWNKRTGGGNAQLNSFAKCVDFMAKGVKAVEDSPAKCTQSRFFLAQSDKLDNSKSFAVSFDLAGGAKIGFGEKKPETASDDEVVMLATKTDKEGAFSVGAMDEGVKPSDGKVFAQKFEEAVPELLKADKVLGAARYTVGAQMPDGNVKFSSFYFFSWLENSGAYRIMMRMPSEDIATAVMMLLSRFGAIGG